MYKNRQKIQYFTRYVCGNRDDRIPSSSSWDFFMGQNIVTNDYRNFCIEIYRQNGKIKCAKLSTTSMLRHFNFVLFLNL